MNIHKLLNYNKVKKIAYKKTNVKYFLNILVPIYFFDLPGFSPIFSLKTEEGQKKIQKTKGVYF